MCSRDHEIMAPAQEETPEHFWQRQIKKLSVQHRFHFGVATPHRIADHHHVRIHRDVFSGIALHQRNSFLLKEAGHRGVNIFVRSGDLKAAFLQRDSNRAHRCSANSEEVKTVGRVLHGSNFYDAPAALASDDLSFRAERSGVEEPRWLTLGAPRSLNLARDDGGYTPIISSGKLRSPPTLRRAALVRIRARAADTFWRANRRDRIRGNVKKGFSRR